jgi:hypothetical protein
MPNQVIDGVRSVYSNCRSYADSGRVEKVICRVDSPSDERTVALFSTSFIRGQRFLFMWHKHDGVPQSNQPHIVVQQVGGVIRSWRSGSEATTQRDLSNAVLSFMGVTFGASARIPLLLAPRRRRWWRSAVPAYEQIDSREIDSTACVALQTTRSNRIETIWVDKTSLLILKVRDEAQFSEEHVRRAQERIHRATQGQRRKAAIEYGSSMTSTDSFRAVITTTYIPTLEAQLDEQDLAKWQIQAMRP